MISLSDLAGENGPQKSDRYAGRKVNDAQMATDLVNARYRNAPRVGEAAPELVLQEMTSSKVRTLADLRSEKPVVLLFTSYGCDVFREALVGLKDVHEAYKDRVNFVMVYIREAHPLDGGFAPSLGRVPDPKTMSARHQAAKLFVDRLRVPFRTILIDSMDDEASVRWAAWPTRIYMVDTDGTVIYAGAQGPWGFRPYKGYKHHIDEPIADDPKYAQESLEEFLDRRFSSDSSDTAPEQLEE